MPEHDSLSTIAEVAVGLAGFSGIAFALQRNPPSYYAFRAVLIVTLAIVTIALALLPIALSQAGMQPGAIWRLGSGASAAVTFVVLPVFMAHRRRAPVEQRISAVFIPTALVTVVNGVAQLLNSIAVLLPGSFSVFYVGLVWYLVLCGIMFIVLVAVSRRGQDPDSPAA